MKPYLSLIIPYHNSSNTIGRLLTSIARSKKAPSYEVIVVDDGSAPSMSFRPTGRNPFRKDPRITEISENSSVNRSKDDKRGSPGTKIRVVRLPQNVGPAIARNKGAKIAKGKFLVFLDSDVELFPDTLHNLAQVYLDDSDVVALTGVWVKEQRSHAFFPNFKALRDWSYWINERDKSGYYFLFSTRIASIKKSVFLRLGGFDETYPAPLVEDIELTYRIARRYAIIFAPKVRVRHEFEDFWPIAKKYFLRAYYWTKLYARRKKFDPVATTWQEALTTISGVGTVAGSLASLFLLPTLPVMFNFNCRMSNVWAGFTCYYPYIVWYMSLFVFVLHLFLIRKFMVFLYKEKGIEFAIKGFVMGLILYCFIFAGAIAGRFKYTG